MANEEFIVDISKPPIGPPITIIKEGLLRYGETKESKLRKKCYEEYRIRYSEALNLNDVLRDPPCSDDTINTTPPMPECKAPKSDGQKEISQRAALAQILEKMDEHSREIIKAIEDFKYGTPGTGPR